MTLLSLTGKQWHARSGAALTQPLSATECRAFSTRLAAERGLTLDTDTTRSAGIDAAVFPDFPVAVARLEQAMEKKERIGIFGDYDCDGITSTALMVRALRRRGVDAVVRLPHRSREGYGLKPHIVEEMHRSGVQLLITLDTGITAVAEIEDAKRRGIDTIILDHHHLPPELPPAVAMLHPALANPAPVASPAAAGITWSFVRGWETYKGTAPWDGWETDLALAAIGTIADLVELRGENRTLVQAGIQALTQIDDGPLGLLRLHAGLEGDRITSKDIGFRIAPRLNAAGRMADPAIALQALLGDHHALLQLDTLNAERQTLVSTLMEEALRLTTSDARRFISLCAPHYPPGICGLLAGKLCEKLARPTLVGCVQEGDMSVASLRSIPGYDVTAALRRSSDLLHHFGGHAQAAGCSFATASFPALQERLAADADLYLSEKDLIPSLWIDAHVDARHLTMDLCTQLHTLEPFGQGNPDPLFLLRGVQLDDVRTVGRDQSHLQARVLGKKLIAFHCGPFADIAKKPIDLVCTLGIDTWQGRLSPQIFVQDLRLAEIPATAARAKSQEPLTKEKSKPQVS